VRKELSQTVMINMSFSYRQVSKDQIKDISQNTDKFILVNDSVRYSVFP